MTHVRLRRSVSFGYAHWFLWVPLTILASISTVAAVVFAVHDKATTTSRRRFLIAYVAYSSTIAILNTVMFGSLVGNLISIKRSLANFNQVIDNKGTKSFGETVEKPQASIPAEDVVAVREGSSWITSPASSRRHPSGSAYSYSHSTTRTRATQNMAASPEQEPGMTFPFSHRSASPRTRPPRRSDPYAKTDFGPVRTRTRTRTQSLRAAAATAAALTVSSQGSWITSSLGTRPTLSAWSYPSTPRSSPRDRTQSASAVQSVIASTPSRDMSPGTGSAHPSITRVAIGGSTRATDLDSDGLHAPSALQAERGTTSPVSSGARSSQIEVSPLRIVAWLTGVWVPLVCPFLFPQRYLVECLPSYCRYPTSPASTAPICKATSSGPLFSRLAWRFRPPS